MDMEERSPSPGQRMNFEEYLNAYGSLTYKNVGSSMMPLLKQGRDTFTLVSKNRPLKKWDAVLFRRKGKYVLHRIIRLHPEWGTYTMLGDNCVTMERDIPEEDVLGIMTEFTHKGKRVTEGTFWYRLYLFFWIRPYPIRIFIKKCLLAGKRLGKKAVPKNNSN